MLGRSFSAAPLASTHRMPMHTPPSGECNNVLQHCHVSTGGQNQPRGEPLLHEDTNRSRVPSEGTVAVVPVRDVIAAQMQ